MLICLMRHGDAEAFSADGKDETRQLTARGHADNKGVAAQLAARLTVFDRYWVSPYRRAQQTADDVLRHYPQAERETREFLVPEADPRFLLDELDAADGDTFLLIGHNPLVSRLAALLTEGKTSAGRYLATSEILAIDTEVVAPACGAIKFALTP